MRKLKVDEIDFRVGMIKKSANGAFCTLLAYKDARVDMAMLDETYGQERWQNEYKRDSKGVLQCGIGVYFDDIGWVWKWSNGIESNTEKQKGEYSDAFKRAGFMWGIGRELYDIPKLFVTMNQDEYYEQNGKVKQTNKFHPNKWDWEITDKHIKAMQNGVQRVYAKYDEIVEVPNSKPSTPSNSKPSTPEKKVVKFGTDEFTKVVDWIVVGVKNKDGELIQGTIERVKELYDIDEEELKKAVMVKKELV